MAKVSEKGKVLALLWANPSTPFAFGGIFELKRYFQNEFTLHQLQQALSQLSSYNLKRKPKRVKHFIPYLVFSNRKHVQADLIQLDYLAPFNSGIKYILYLIDTNSRFAHARPIKDKSGPKVADALDDIFQDMARTGPMPRLCLTDYGVEFRNEHTQNVFRGWGIKHIHPRTGRHAHRIERAILDVKRRLFSFMAGAETKRYIDVLPQLVLACNRHYHRVIKMSPEAASLPANAQRLLETQLQNFVRLQHKIQQETKARNRSRGFPSRLTTGTLVRRAVPKEENSGTFRKSYHDQYDPHICEIIRVIPHLLKPLYELRYVTGPHKGRRLRFRHYRESVRAIMPNITARNFPSYQVLEERVSEKGEKELLLKFDALPAPKYRFWFKEKYLKVYFKRRGDGDEPHMIVDPGQNEEGESSGGINDVDDPGGGDDDDDEDDPQVVYPYFSSGDELEEEDDDEEEGEVTPTTTATATAPSTSY